MRKLFLSLLFLLLSACSACRPPAYVPRSGNVSLEYLKRATVQLEQMDSDLNVTGWATGWVIENDGLNSIIATAGHVCEEESLYFAKTHDKNRYLAFPIYDDDVQDVCLMAAPVTGRLAKLEVSTRKNLLFGEPLVFVGYPQGVLSVYEGRYTGEDTDGSQIGAMSGYFGASGSAVVDRFGQVIGVFSAISPAFPQISVYTPLESVQRLAKIAHQYIEEGSYELKDPDASQEDEQDLE